MTLPCPECGGTARVAETRVTANGKRRRRLRCTVCSHRWTVVVVNTPNRPPVEMIADIRSSDEPETVLALRHGCSPSTVGAIRRGQVWADVAVNVPLRRSCQQCLHWHRNCCSLGFPDPREEGIAFARQCVTFQRVTV